MPVSLFIRARLCEESGEEGPPPYPISLKGGCENDRGYSTIIPERFRDFSRTPKLFFHDAFDVSVYSFSLQILLLTTRFVIVQITKRMPTRTK